MSDRGKSKMQTLEDVLEALSKNETLTELNADMLDFDIGFSKLKRICKTLEKNKVLRSLTLSGLSLKKTKNRNFRCSIF